MILRLQHQRPDGEIDTYHLKPGRRYHIGRGSACEVRILDLKLSRKHCAIEFNAGAWHVVDLLSTNGCTLDGTQIVGSIPLQPGSQIEAGQTVLIIANPDDHDHVDSVVQSKDPEHEDTPVHSPIEQETLPAHANGDAKADRQDDETNSWEPEPGPGPDPSSKTEPLVPKHPDQPTKPVRPAAAATGDTRKPTAVFKAEELALDHQDGEQTRQHERDEEPKSAAEPASPAPAPVPAKSPTEPGTDRTYFITVLGRRVGPLTRTTARDLKARELRGSLTTADLEGYPLG